VIMSERPELKKTDFLFSSRKESLPAKETLSLDDMERKAILMAIQKYHGNMSKVAKELGVGRTTLYRKMARYGIEK
jgi:two-component system, NtrC family, response regulator HydG